MLLVMAAALTSLDCVAVGDSLALGVGTAINSQARRPRCRIAATKGEPASRMARTLASTHADVVVLSA